MSATTWDHLSLELPSLSKLRSRWRRPKRPDAATVVWTVIVLIHAVDLFLDVLTGQYRLAGKDTVSLAVSVYALRSKDGMKRVMAWVGLVTWQVVT